MAIRSFAREELAAFFATGRAPRRRGWAAAARVVARKLDMLRYAKILADLRSPPGNRLEALSGRRRGYHSIRVNDQWRVVFRWEEGGPTDVDVVDYHG